MRLLSAFLLMLAPAGAQWLNYRTPGVPRTPSGLPNLGAPTPRAADGHPDLSGIWEADHNIPCPPSGCWDMRAGPQFFDISTGVNGGLPFQPWAATLRKARAQSSGDDHETHCLPSGVPRMLMHPTFRKILQQPQLIIMLVERNSNFRQIFLDGRGLPQDPNPTWYGYSVGHWDQDTLVVETNGLRDNLWLDRGGTPLTDAARITERFHRINYGNLDVQVTIDDPKAYTAPWSTTIKQYLAPDTELIEYICLENERDTRHFK